MIESINKHILLSQLWLFILLNMIFRDIHEIFYPPTIQELMGGTFNGQEIPEWLMLIGGFMVLLPINMVFISRVVKRVYSRRFNLIIAPFSLISILMNGTRDMDDVLFVVVKSITLISIFVIALKWKESK